MIPLLAVVALVVVGLDQLTKTFAMRGLQDGDVVLLGGVLRLTLVRNAGAAFSLGTGSTGLLTVLAVGVVVFVAVLARRIASFAWAVAFGLLIGGALGNLSDRIFRAPGPFRGHVVDWIALPHWPVFNVADSAITCAAVLVVLLSVLGIHLDGSRDRRRTPETDETPETPEAAETRAAAETDERS